MASSTPPEGNSLFPNDIDLSEIFIGREDQINQFLYYLEHWQPLAANSVIPDLKGPPSPNDKIQGFVVLIHGRGGFGKSMLLKRYHEIALEYTSVMQISNLINWEFAAQERRALFNPAQGENIDASQYFNFMRDQLAYALSRQRSDFREYLSAVRAVDEAKKQAQGVLKGLQREDRYPWLRSLPGNLVLTLIQSVPIVKNSPLLKNDAITNAISEAANAGFTIGVEQIAQVRARLHESLGSQFSDYLDASWRLGKAIGSDLAQFARKRIILIFFDTYEEIDEGDKFLRMIMGAAGGRVGWVIAGRDNLWAGVGQRLRSVEQEYGYKDILLPDRRMVIDFSADGVGDFTASDIEDYFTQFSKKADRLALPAITEKDAVHIRDVTAGVPLAVKIAAGLYLENPDLALITESLDGKREIVDQMVDRYLLHTRTNPTDRALLYGLALLRRPDEPRALAAALDVPGNYDAELSRLHRRYGFIFTKQEKPALHQEVRHFLRLWLLDHRISNADIMRVAQHLRKAYLTSFQVLETRRHYRSLRARLEDEQWIGLYLDLTEQQFWLNPAEGVAYILPFMVASSVYHREVNREARTIGEFFQGTLVQPYRKQWNWANQSLVYNTSRNPLPEELSGLKDVVRLASQVGIAFFPPMPLFQEELEAALWWRLGEAYRGKNPDESVYWYEKALSRLHQEEDLRGDLEDARWEKDYKVTREKPDPPIEQNPKSVHEYTQRGEVYLLQGEYRRAITDFDHALELDMQNASLYAKRGDAYLLLREYRRAITDFDHALELEPGNEAICTKRNEASSALIKSQQVIQRKPPEPVRSPHIGRRLLVSLIGLGLVTGGGIIWLARPQRPQVSSHSTPTTLPPLGTTLYTYYGHSDAVNTVSWSPDGKRIASGSNDATIHVWDATTGNHVLIYIGHSSTLPVSSVTWSPNGERIASGSYDKTVQVWNATTTQHIYTYNSHTDAVQTVAWSPNGKYIASGSYDHTVQVWDAATGEHIYTYRKHTDAVIGVAWSPDGKRIASGSYDNTVQAWDATTGKNITIYHGHTDAIQAVAWSPNSKYIASGSDDNTVMVWYATTGRTLLTYKKHTDNVLSVAWSPDSKHIASGSRDKTAQLWDATGGSNIYTYSQHTDWVWSVVWSPDGKHIASGSRDKTVRVWKAS